MGRIIGYITTSEYIEDDTEQYENINKEYPNIAYIITSIYPPYMYAKDIDYVGMYIYSFKAGDTVIYDSIINMGMDAEDVATMYVGLFVKNVKLIFIQDKELCSENFIGFSQEYVKEQVKEVFTKKFQQLEDGYFQRRIEEIRNGGKQKINKTWDDTYELCVQYYTGHGNLNIPGSYCIDDYKLGRWISKQRQRYKKGELSEGQINKLEQIGMIWKIR